MAETNLIVLTKYENLKIPLPTEQISLCNEHYEMKKEIFGKDYQVNRVCSSMPKIWCEICTPPEFGV